MSNIQLAITDPEYMQWISTTSVQVNRLNIVKKTREKYNIWIILLLGEYFFLCFLENFQSIL